jgi:hypothetical protein
MMEPCCLSTKRVHDREECAEHADLLGGKTGFTEGECPSSAEDANAMLSDDSDEGNNDENDNAENDNEPMLGQGVAADSVEEQKTKVNKLLEEDKRVAQLKEQEAQEKLALQKQKEVRAVSANSATSELDAKSAARAAADVALEAKAAALKVMNDILLQKQLESVLVRQKIEKLKEEIKVYEKAIQQAKALTEVRAVDDVAMNLTASALDKMKELKETEQAEKVAREEVEAAKAHVAEAEAALEKARSEAEKAKRAEEDSRNSVGQGQIESTSSTDG